MSSSSLLFVSIVVFIAINLLVTVSAADLSKCSFTQKDSKFSHFYPLSSIPDSQPEGFSAKVKVSVSSDYGDIHILLSESDDIENTNRVYEFAADSGHDGGEIRRRNSVYGKYELLTKTNKTVEDHAPRITTFEFSVSTDGVIKVSVLSPNSTISIFDDSVFAVMPVDFNNYRVVSSDYSIETKDQKPFPINFISFSGHSKLQFNCDYGVFQGEENVFIQTRCEAIYGWSQEQLFHPLDSINQFKPYQPDEYFAKVEISMLSDYGNMHVILSETNEKSGPNPCYEIVIADRFNTVSEFRRKNSISESYDFVNQTSFSYNVKDVRAAIMMQISLSVDGVLSFTDITKNVTFNFTDSESTIPVKYITFAGYRNWPATYEIDCLNAKTTCS